MDKIYNTGDILVVPTWPVPIFDHFAMVFYMNGKGYVAHNSFRSGKVIVHSLDEFTSTRTLRRIIKTDGSLSDQDIYDRTQAINASGKSYDLFGYNCESYVREVCNCDIGVDQRSEMLMVLFGFTIVLLLAKIAFSI